jgi:hypothetical protein
MEVIGKEWSTLRKFCVMTAAILAVTLGGFSAYMMFSKSSAALDERVYVGKTMRDEAISITMRGNSVVAYVCDGKKIGNWLQGEIDKKGTARLTAPNGDRITGLAKKGAFKGTYKSSSTGRLLLKAVSGNSGIYEAAASIGGKSTTVGWVVSPGGHQVGVVQAGDQSYSAPRMVDFKWVHLGNLKVRVSRVWGARQHRRIDDPSGGLATEPGPRRTRIDGPSGGLATEPGPRRTRVDNSESF